MFRDIPADSPRATDGHPDRRAFLDNLVRSAAELAGRDRRDVRVVRAPYRLCPVGAHLDHQDGEVTGFALDRALHLAYVPSPQTQVRLRSLDVVGFVEFDIADISDAIPDDWGNYARGAALALGAHHPIQRGITGVVAGEMRAGGVSTSAALGIACLLALEDANELEIPADDNIRLDQEIENGYLGLKNGILDQSMILHGRADALVHLDCRTREIALHPRHENMPDFALLAVYSGVERALVDTGYNQRVLECQRAAAKVLQASGRRLPGLPRLRDISLPEFQAQSEKLPENERRRAEHYFGEMDRVRRGVAAWRAGRLDDLGRAVTETGESSIHNYECGSPELIALFELLAAESGVYGARFSGAGFRGYCMALVDPSRADAIVASVAGRYLERFPNYRPAFHAHLCRPSDGARVLRDETWG